MLLDTWPMARFFYMSPLCDTVGLALRGHWAEQDFGLAHYASLRWFTDLANLPWNVRRTHLSFHTPPPQPFFPNKFTALQVHFSSELAMTPLLWREFCFLYHHPLHSKAHSGSLSSRISRDNDKNQLKVANLLWIDAFPSKITFFCGLSSKVVHYIRKSPPDSGQLQEGWSHCETVFSTCQDYITGLCMDSIEGVGYGWTVTNLTVKRCKTPITYPFQSHCGKTKL